MPCSQSPRSASRASRGSEVEAMRRAAIVAPLRTPVGTFGGSLRSVPVETLGAAVVRAILEKIDWTRR